MPETTTTRLGDTVVTWDPATRIFKIHSPSLIIEGQLAQPPAQYTGSDGQPNGVPIPPEMQATIGSIEFVVAILDALAKMPGLDKKDKAAIKALANELSDVSFALRTGQSLDHPKETVGLAIKTAMDAAGDRVGDMITTTLLGAMGLTASSWSGPAAPFGAALAIGIGQAISDAISDDKFAAWITDMIFLAGETIVEFEQSHDRSVFDMLRDSVNDWVDFAFPGLPPGVYPVGVTATDPKTAGSVQVFSGNYTFNEVSFAGATGGVSADLSVEGAQNGGAAGQIEFRTIEGLVGSSYNDTLIGNFANNQFRGGAGDDFIDGGDGFDYADYSDAGDSVVIDLRVATQVAGDRGGDTLIDIEGVIGGGGDDILTGNDGDNVLIGGGGDDILSGGGGNDLILANTDNWTTTTPENDFVDGGDGFDIISFGPSQAYVHGWLRGTMSANVDLAAGTATVLYSHVTLTSVEGVIGSTTDDILLGSAANNQFFGLQGSDFINGRAGDDYIDGGAGVDVLDGGDGIDTLGLQSSDRSVTASLYSSTINGDTVSGFENLVGSEFADVLGGSAGANILSGARGSDYLHGDDGDDILNGGSGDDSLFGGAGNDSLFGDAGVDYVTYADSIDGVAVNLNAGTASSLSQGNDTLAGIENVFGSNYDDLLIGSSGANTLQGGLGRDVIIGLAGDDIIFAGAGQANELYGGIGDDYYLVEANDTIIEHAGEGVDSVEARVSSYTLAANIENLFYGGTGSFTGAGNASNNVLMGGSYDDVLTGGGGNDRFYGGEGNDTVVLRGLEDEYLIEYVTGGIRITDLVTGRDGDALLIDVEKVSFSDGSSVDLPVVAGRGVLSGEGTDYPTFRPHGFDEGDPWWFAGARSLEAEISGL